MTSSRGHVTLIFLLAGLVVRLTEAAFYDDEKSLRTAVLTGYEYKIRPEATVSCNVRLSLLNINILDVTGQRLSVSGWLTIAWSDSRLTWTPATYGGITDFYDTELVLWRPELIVDNAIANLDIIENDKLLIRATSAGVLTWEPPGIFETHCDVDVTYYPFDTQVCIIEVTSWGYTVDEVNLAARDESIYLDGFQKSGEWEILNTESKRQLLLDGTEYHSQLDFKISLRRLPSYYVMTIVIPVIVTSVLCILVFLLPAESGEKVGYTLTILLTYVVMLTLVAGYMPPTSTSTSLLSIYLTAVLFLGVFSTLATVLTLYFYHHDEEEPIPSWMLKVWTNVLIPIASWKRKGSSGGDNEAMDVYIASPTKDRKKVHPTPPVSPSYNDKANLNGQPTMVKPRSGQEQLIEPGQLTWKEISLIMDAALFKVLTIFLTLMTLALLLSLIIGGYS